MKLSIPMQEALKTIDKYYKALNAVYPYKGDYGKEAATVDALVRRGLVVRESLGPGKVYSLTLTEKAHKILEELI